MEANLLLKADSHIHVFDACGCGRQLRFHRDRKISIFLHRTLLLQPHASIAACLNEPLAMQFGTGHIFL